MAKNKLNVEKNGGDTYVVNYAEGKGYGYAMVFEGRNDPSEVRDISFDVRCGRLSGVKAEGEGIALDMWVSEEQLLELRESVEQTLKGIAMRRKQLQAVRS